MSNTYLSRRFIVKKDLQHLSAGASASLIQKVKDADQLSQQVLTSASEVEQQNLTGEILEPKFLTKLDPQVTDDQQALRATAFEFRSLSEPLRIPFPEPVLEVKTRSWAYAGCLGAVMGMFAGGSLSHYLLDMRDAGMLTGAPAGALLFLLLLGYLVNHPRVMRTVQAAFGAATVLEIASMAGATFNPLGMLWRSVTKHFTGKGIITRFKRIAVYLAGILVLQLAVPKAKIRWDQLENNTRESIDSWLTYHVNILVLLLQASHLKTELGVNDLPEPIPVTLLNSLQKLAETPMENRSDIADEVIQEFYNAGFKEADIPDKEHFQADYYEHFDVLGLIEPGDPFKILEKPVIKDGKIIKKGRLTRVRD